METLPVGPDATICSLRSGERHWVQLYDIICCFGGCGSAAAGNYRFRLLFLLYGCMHAPRENVLGLQQVPLLLQLNAVYACAPCPFVSPLSSRNRQERTARRCHHACSSCSCCNIEVHAYSPDCSAAPPVSDFLFPWLPGGCNPKYVYV